jgi:hypothetical protein
MIVVSNQETEVINEFEMCDNRTWLIILELGHQNINTLDARIELCLINLVRSLLNFLISK